MSRSSRKLKWWLWKGATRSGATSAPWAVSAGPVPSSMVVLCTPLGMSMPVNATSTRIAPCWVKIQSIM